MMKKRLIDQIIQTDSYRYPFAGKTTTDVTFQLPDGTPVSKTILVDKVPTDEPHLSVRLLDIDSLVENGNTALLKHGIFKSPTDLDRSEYLSDAIMSDFKANEASFVQSVIISRHETNS